MIITTQTYRRSIDALMQEAGRHDVPSAIVEKELVRQAKAGDTRALHQLILGHLRLVIKIAHSYSRGNSDLFEELSASGVAGMIEAIGMHKASSNKGGRFMHYAIWHVRRQMRKVLNEYRTPVTTNPNNYDLARKIFAYEEQIQQTTGRKPTHKETGQKFGFTPNRVERLKKLMESPMYLDHAANADDERNGHDICADRNAASPALSTEATMESEMLQQMMAAHLTQREIDILNRRFGFRSGQIDDLTVIGRDYSLSRERVRQIETQALKKLRFHLSQHCPTYRTRTDAALGLSGHAAILPSRMAVPAVHQAQKTPATKKAALSPTLRSLPTRQASVSRELELVA